MSEPRPLPNQDEWEYARLLELLEFRRPARVLEIGTKQSGWCAGLSPVLADFARVVAVDISDRYQAERMSVSDWLQTSRHATFDVLIGDSHSPETLRRVRSACADPLDLLHIDGDHSYAGCRTDYEMYAPLVRPGGLIAIHDVHHALAPGVHQFWDELRRGEHGPFRRTWEWLHPRPILPNNADGPMGIGVLEVAGPGETCGARRAAPPAAAAIAPSVHSNHPLDVRMRQMRALGSRVCQQRPEMAAGWQLFREMQPHLVIEIGAWMAGWTYLMAGALNEPATFISIVYDGETRYPTAGITAVRDRVAAALSAEGHAVHYIQGRSNDPALLNNVHGILQGRSADVVHIDGDHHEAAVLEDWQNYSALVRPGGAVLFHDADNPTEEVPRAWQRIVRSMPEGRAEFRLIPGVPGAHPPTGLGIVRLAR